MAAVMKCRVIFLLSVLITLVCCRGGAQPGKVTGAISEDSQQFCLLADFTMHLAMGGLCVLYMY